MGDHGGIILIAPDQEPTNKIYYTTNEGIAWETLFFSELKVEVSNIVIEPSTGYASSNWNQLHCLRDDRKGRICRGRQLRVLARQSAGGKTGRADGIKRVQEKLK